MSLCALWGRPNFNRSKRTSPQILVLDLTGACCKPQLCGLFAEPRSQLTSIAGCSHLPGFIELESASWHLPDTWESLVVQQGTCVSVPWSPTGGEVAAGDGVALVLAVLQQQVNHFLPASLSGHLRV